MEGLIIGIVILVLLSLMLAMLLTLAIQDKAVSPAFSCVLLCLVCLLTAFGLTHDVSYRQGQIDAALGKQKYHLTTQPDNTVKWEKIESNK